MVDLSRGTQNQGVQKEAADMLGRRDALYEGMLRSDEPHEMNRQLNELEQRLELTQLKSFPINVSMNMTSICNAKCRFCVSVPKRREFADFVQLDDIRKMDWLRYVSTFCFTAGYGEPLVNPEFPAVFDHISRTFPHLKLLLVTNGITLSPASCESFVGRLAEIRVSLNAATRHVWQKVMGVKKGFDNILAMYRLLRDLRNDSGSDLPVLNAQMILFRDTIHQVVDFVDLAADVGVDRVVLSHYHPASPFGRKDIPVEQSMYFDRPLSDRMVAQAVARAKERGLEIYAPIPFTEEAPYIAYGTRCACEPSRCWQPWTNCFLSCVHGRDRHLDAKFCCILYSVCIPYGRCRLDEETFHKSVWNHVAARYFRKAALAGENPVCRFCFKHDQFDPDSKPILEQLGGKLEEAFQDVREDDLLAFVKQRVRERTAGII